jgi:hypothetical protein
MIVQDSKAAPESGIAVILYVNIFYDITRYFIG